MSRVIALIALLASVALTLASAVPASADPPGNNGTVKVHDGDSEDEPIQANEPHVGCSFHLHGLGFDANATGTWRVVAWPPTGDGGSVRWNGTWTGDRAGAWRTGLLAASSADMVDGRAHFKVFADQDGAPGGEKHKVFWVECGGASTLPPTRTPTPAAGVTPVPTQLGFEQPPRPPRASVAPIVEVPVPGSTGSVGVPGRGPVASAAPAVAGVETPPGSGSQPVTIAGLPSTSTVPVPTSFASALALAVIGAATLWRRRAR